MRIRGNRHGPGIADNQALLFVGLLIIGAGVAILVAYILKLIL